METTVHLKTAHFEHSRINHDLEPKLGIRNGRLFVQKIAQKCSFSLVFGSPKGNKGIKRNGEE